MTTTTRRGFLSTLFAAPLAGLAALGIGEREPDSAEIQWVRMWGPADVGICQAEARWRPVWGKRCGEWRTTRHQVTKSQPMAWLTKNIGIGLSDSESMAKTAVPMELPDLGVGDWHGWSDFRLNTEAGSLNVG